LEGSQVTDEGLVEIASSCRSLKALSLKRTGAGNDSLQAIALNCGKHLQRLDLNGLFGITDETLTLIAENCPNLEELDVSWLRAVDDVVMGKFLATAGNLARVSVWGCNKLTSCAFSPRAADLQKSLLKISGQFIVD